MIAGPHPEPQRIRDRLAGQHLLVTGSTGFLAKAFVEKLVRSVDTLGGIHLLVRAKSGNVGVKQRVMQEVLGSPAFDRLRAMWGERFQELCDEKIHVVPGDLTRERFGLTESAYSELTRRITLVVNSAATVTFDERLDWAIDLNALGPSRLLRFARDCGNAPFMHVSTCYVCGRRTGVVVEDFSAPEIAREKLPRLAEGRYDLDALLQDMTEQCESIIASLGSDTEPCRRELIDRGMSIAREYGWNDTYTFTKWIGEQLLIRDCDRVPLVIFRPAIIEGSFDEPMPGWIDGLRMADPIIVAYGKGKLHEFPARADLPIDFIPVDFVANAMVATLPMGDARPSAPAVYQCASSDRNPFTLEEMRTGLIRAFRKRPMHDDDGRPIDAGALRVVERDEFVRGLLGKQRWLQRYRRLLERLGAASRRIRRINAVLRQIDQLVYFAKIYSPYTHLDCRFATDELDAAGKRLHPDDAALYPFDVQRIDWDDYLVNRHVPGLRSFVLGTGAEPSRRIRGGEGAAPDEAVFAHTLQGKTIFDVFRRTADRFPHKPALQIKRRNRWIRYTYEEAMRATGAIARRLNERGLTRGDRVAICAENGPEWGLAYLGIMRAGMTAVPLDPQTVPEDVWSAVRFADAKLLLVSPGTRKQLTKAREDDDADVVLMREPFVPPPGAARDVDPDEVPVDGTSIASILFTSGTTVAPKAVPLTHRNLIANAQGFLQIHPVKPTDELLSVLPLYHSFEFTGGFFAPISGGATITYVDQLKGPEITAAMQATGTTVMLVVPRLLRMFLDSIERKAMSTGGIRATMFRLLRFGSRMTGDRYARTFFAPVHRAFGGHLRMFVCGGSRLEPDLLEGMQRLGFPVYEGYGLTETAPVLTVNPPGAARPGSVGPALPNVSIEIRNPTLEGIGEVWACGPCVMGGYLHNAAVTSEVVVDGWFRTGDLGRMDADGYLHLTGRSKDLIVTGAGKNVYPDEVEARYGDLPHVKELCVFGMTSGDGMGDRVHAVVVIDPASAPELDRSSLEREVRAAVAATSETLPTHQRIAAVHIWDRELPKTSTLKAKRGLIRDMVLAEELNAATPTTLPEAPSIATATPASPEAMSAVCTILARQSRRPESSIRPSMHLLLDLGIDSIGKIDLLGAIEATFGMQIDDATGAKIARVSDLLAAIGSRPPVSGGARSSDAWQRRLTTRADGEACNGTLPAPLLPIRWLMRGAVGGFMHSYVRVHARDREHIPAGGPFILAPNHSSHLDSPAVLTAVGGRRRVWVAGAEDYFFNTALKRFVFGKVLDTIAFDRHSDGLAGLRRCGAALTRGDGLLLFPEGTRSTSGEIQPFRIGAAVLAVERKAPIVPVHVDHAYELFPKGKKMPRPGTITVSFGKPVPPPTAQSPDEHYTLFHEMIREVESAVRTMAHEVAR